MITNLEKVNEDKWPRSTHKLLNQLVDLFKRELKIQMVSETEAPVVEQSNGTVTWKIPSGGGIDADTLEMTICVNGSPDTVNFYVENAPAPEEE